MELEAADPGARDPVVHVVEERDHDAGFQQRVLELSIERFAGGRPRFGARLVEEAIGLGRGVVRAHAAGLGVKEVVREVVGVVVVRDPAPEEQVDLRVVVPGSEVRRHGLRHDLDLDADLRPEAQERLGQRGVLVLEDRVDAGAKPHGKRQAGGAHHLDGLFLREVRLAAPRVVAEDAGRDQARGRKGEPPERSPDEVLGVGDARQRQAQRPRASRRRSPR